MSNNSDMIKLLTLMEGQQFAGEPEQKPGDQVRGTDRAAKNGKQHPFHNRLVGEELSLEDKLAKKYQDMKDLHGNYDSDWDYQDAVANSGRSRSRSSDSYDAHDAENDAYEMHKRFAATRARKEAEAKAAAEKAKTGEQGVAEGEGNFAKAIENLHGWYQRDSSDPDVEVFDFEDGEGGYYAQGNIEHNLKTGEITIDFEDTSGEYGKPEVSGTYNSIGDAMNALRGITTQMRYNSGKKPNFDTLGGRSIAGSNDVYKTDKAGKKGTLGKARMDTMKASSPYRMRGGPKGKLPEGEVVPLGKKHRGDLGDIHSCPKCGGELQGGNYMGQRVKVCQPCKQVYLPPNSGIDQQGNKTNEQGVAEAEKNPHPETWHDVDPKLGKAVDKMSQAEKVKKGWAMDPSQRVDPRTGKKMVQKGVAEGSEQVYNIVAVDKSNAMSKPKKLTYKAGSIEEVFDALAANDWYPLEINGVEVINGKHLKQGVAEGSGGNWYIRVNGKILNDTKFKPVIFSSEDEARSHAMKLADKKRIPLSQMKLTKSWMDAPEQGVAEEGYGTHPSQRVDPRTGKKYVPPKSPLGQGVAEGEVVPLGKKHRGDLSDTHSCPKCGGDLQGGKYMGHAVKVCQPCKQVYLPPNSGIDQQGNKTNEQGVAEAGYPEVDHMPGPTIKRTQTGCKRCHGKGYVYKTPDGEVHPTNQIGAKKYKCGKCDGIGFVKVAEQGVSEAGDTLGSVRNRLISRGVLPSDDDRLRDSERARQNKDKYQQMHHDTLDKIHGTGAYSPNADGVLDVMGFRRDGKIDDWYGDEERAHRAQQRMARDEYDLQRRKDDDEDTRQTINMYRDRLNRFQSRTQRDVDPEQLAAISNIKYEPRKNASESTVDEAMGGGVDSKGRTQGEWLQLVKRKFPGAKVMVAKMQDGPCYAVLPDGRKLSWSKVDQGVTEELDDHNPVVSAISRRIMHQRLDLLQKYGVTKVMSAIDEVADFVGDVEEIGSSDVSGWVKHVEQMLGNMGELDEADVPPVAGAVPAVPGTTPPAGTAPTTTATGAAPAQNPADIMKQKNDQRKAIQDQITATTKQLADLRTQLSSIQ